MTITYTLEVSRAKFWGFPKLLARWRGSIYRLIYREMLFFLVAYYILMYLYRGVLEAEGRRLFELTALYCRDCTSVVLVTFLLGFYVTLVMGRWWQQYMNIQWPDKVAMEISAYVQGTDERSRLIRRALARYLNLMSIFTFQNTSTVIKRRFPTLEHLVEAGLMTVEEKIEVDNTKTTHGIWWMPAHWFSQLAIIARKEGRIHDDLHLKSLMDDMLDYRGQCGMIWSFDWISVPLVYTQVVTIAVYSFFAAALFGRQYLLKEGMESEHVIDYYVPVFTIFQFFFFVGWLKVAESMICPFGEDDDDFDVNWIIDRNFQVAYLIVDKLHRRTPVLTKDMFWDNVEPELPYTAATAQFRKEPFVGSTTAMNIPDHETLWEDVDQMPAISEEDVENTLRRRKQSDKDEECNSDDSDAESQASRRLDDKRKKRGLGGLMLGFSRQTLSSKIGSKFGSVNSISGNSKACTTRPSTPPVSSQRHYSLSEKIGGSVFLNRNRTVDTDQEVSGSKDSMEIFSNLVNESQDVLGTAAALSNANLSEKMTTPLPVVQESETDQDHSSGGGSKHNSGNIIVETPRRSSWSPPVENAETTPFDDCGSTTPLYKEGN